MSHGHQSPPLPASIDLRDICVPQSQVGSTCDSVAFAGAVWAAQNKQAGHITERPSARFLFWASGERSVGAIAHAISARGGLGVVPASLWDWVKNSDGTNATTADGRAAVDPDAMPPADVIAFGAQHLAVVEAVQRNVDAIRGVLASGFPVLYNGNGVHAAVVVGYDETTFLIMDSRPSHSPDVDERGYFWRCDFQAFLDGSKDCYVVRSVQG